MRAAQGRAALAGRSYVLPDDVKHLVQPVLAHRVLPAEETRLEGAGAQKILAEIVADITVPE